MSASKFPARAGSTFPLDRVERDLPRGGRHSGIAEWGVLGSQNRPGGKGPVALAPQQEPPEARAGAALAGWTGGAPPGRVTCRRRDFPIAERTSMKQPIGMFAFLPLMANNCWLSGSIDEARIYNSALNACQIKALQPVH